MRKNIFFKALLMIFFIGVSTASPAQGFFKKLTKVVKPKEQTTVTNEAVDTTAAGSSIVDNLLSTKPTKKIAVDSIPVYHAVKVFLTDDNGNKVNNPDGTQSYRILLQDQFGNWRSKEVVEKQHAQLKKEIGQIWAKVGKGAAVGALAGLATKGVQGAAVGAVGGAIGGLIASFGNIKNISKINKSIKQQKTLIETYANNFNEEGIPIDAKIEPEKISDLGIKESNALTMSTSQIKDELSKADFNNASNSVLDDISNVAQIAENIKKDKD